MQKYAFRGIDDVLNALSPALVRNGLVIMPEVLEREVVEKPSRNGGCLFYVTVKVRYTMICADDGSSHDVIVYGEAMDSGDKATNKAMSAAYKYMAIQSFAIATEGDNDADRTTHYPVQHNNQQQPQQRQQSRNGHEFAKPGARRLPNHSAPTYTADDAARERQQKTQERQQMADDIVNRYQPQQNMNQVAQEFQQPHQPQQTITHRRSEDGPNHEEMKMVHEQEQAQERAREKFGVLLPFQHRELMRALNAWGVPEAETRFCRAAKVNRVGELTQDRFHSSMEWIQRKATQ